MKTSAFFCAAFIKLQRLQQRLSFMIIGKRRTLVATFMSNGLGISRVAAFIQLWILCPAPFVCYYHPEGKRSSLVDSRSIFCFESGAFVCIAFVAKCLNILRPVLHLSLYAYAALTDMLCCIHTTMDTLCGAFCSLLSPGRQALVTRRFSQHILF